MAVPSGGAARAEYHRRDVFAVEWKPLADRHCLLRSPVVVAGEQNRPTVGLIADQSCVDDSKAPRSFLCHRGEHLGRRHRSCDQRGNAVQRGLLVSEHTELVPAFLRLPAAPICFRGA